MEDKKWIFIEKSLETVRYKVGDSDSSMDSQGFELLPAKDSPPPSVYEFIPSKKEEILSGDELDIHDNHFLYSSCPTSDTEDSDIEVVMKSPSTSETASLCSLNSQKSQETRKYEEMIFNVPISEKLTSANEEEDSEVEVISRSIHRNGSIEMAYVEENNEDISLNTPLSTSGSENENEGEIEESRTTNYNASFTPENEAEEEQCHLQSYDKTNQVNYMESIEDYGIKYLFEDLHVSRQINSRLVGLKTSTLVLTVCLSVTLGIYLGNYLSPMSNGLQLENEDASLDDTVFVPEDVVHSTNEDPSNVNITFKYSSSTKESLRNVLNSFRKLQHDYDRLHSAFADLKERCYLKKQMTFYWRKQVKENSIEHYEKEHVAEDDIPKVSQQPDAMLKLTEENVLNDMNNGTSQSYHRTIRKLSRDLTRERNTAMYWRKRYNDVELSKNTCSKYGPKSTSFSFSDCFNIFSKVIPTLDISVINITNPAENLADQVQNAWSQLRSRWNAKKTRKDDPVHLGKVNRFRKIFNISNVVNSASHVRNHIFNRNIHAKTYKNESLDQIQSNSNPQLDFNVTVTRKNQQSKSLEMVNMAARVCAETTNDKHNDSRDYKNRDLHVQDKSSESMDGFDWFRNKFLESRFLFDIYKWKSNFQNEIDILKSRSISHLMNENEKQSRKIEELRNLENENIILKKKVIENGEYFENTRNKLKYLKVSERKKCNSSIAKVKKTIERRYNHLIKNIQTNVRKAEKSKYSKRVHSLLTSERRRYHLSIKKIRKTIRKEEKTKFKRKLRTMKKSFKQVKEREYKKFKLKYKNKKLRQEQKERLHRNRKHLRSKNRNRHKNRKLKKDISHYASKYQRSVKEVAQLTEMYSEAMQKVKHQEQVVKDYKDELERYKEIIKEYEQRINKVIQKENHLEEQIHNFSQRMNQYNKILRENARLKRSVSTFTSAARDKKVLYVDVKKKENEEELVEPMNQSEIENDYILKMPRNKCYTDTDHKPFYNINDVYPEDLFGRKIKINPPSPSRPPNMLPNLHTSPSFSNEPDNLHMHNSQKLFDLSRFSEKFSFSGTNESQSENKEVHASLYGNWDEGSMELNEYSRNEHFAIPNNWYINWMQEKNKNRKVDSFDFNVYEKEGYWFWKAMKEREKMRSYEGEVNWFWKAMKEREKLRKGEEEAG